MRDEDTSAYDGTAEDLQREASGISPGDLPMLFAAIVIGLTVGLFNNLRRRTQPEPPKAESAAPAPAAAARPAPTARPAEFLHPHGA